MTLTAHGQAELLALSGRNLGHTAWREIGQSRIDTFADATDDHQWIHVDPGRAASGPFGGTIAHGYLTLALIIPLFGELLDIKDVRMSVNYGLERVRFPAPVPAGSRIRLAGTVASAEQITGDAVQLVLDFTVQSDRSAKPACVARAVHRHYV